MKYGVRLCLLIVALGTGLPAIGQTDSTPDQDRGFTEVESFQGTLNSSNKLLRLDSSLGYDFNKHFSVFTGVPMFYSNVVDVTGTSSTGKLTNNGVGNVYLGMEFRLPHDRWSFTSSVTGTAPTGSKNKGYSTGKATVDWTNRFGYSFGRFTPFAAAGLANTVSDTPLVSRPFTSFGPVGHFEEGAIFDVGHHVSLGGSAYQILPSGSQTVYSQVVLPSESGTAPDQVDTGNPESTWTGAVPLSLGRTTWL
jgi:hypothetical protein